MNVLCLSFAGGLVFHDTVLQAYNFSAIADTYGVDLESALPDAVPVPASLPPELAQLLNGTSDSSGSVPPELAALLNGTPIPPELVALLNGTSILPAELAQLLSGTPIPANSSINNTPIPPELVQYLNGTGYLNGTAPYVNVPQSVNKTAVVEAIERLRGGEGSGMGFRVPLTIMHNTSSDHALPALIAELAQAKLRGKPSSEKLSLYFCANTLFPSVLSSSSRFCVVRKNFSCKDLGTIGKVMACPVPRVSILTNLNSTTLWFPSPDAEQYLRGCVRFCTVSMC